MTTSRYECPSAVSLLFLALAGYAANLLGTAAHEFIGHGLVALLLGGQFHDAFVSPLDGQAGATAPGARNAIVLAAGAIVELSAGVAVWMLLRRRLQAKTPRSLSLDRTSPLPWLFAWLFAVQAMLDSLIYICVAPFVQAMVATASGDWPLLLQASPLPRLILFVAGMILIVPLTAALMRDAVALYRGALFTAGESGPVFLASARPNRAIVALLAYVTLLLPSLLLRGGYAVAVQAWLAPPLPIIFGSLADLMLLGLPGAAWIWWRNRRQQARSPSRAVEAVYRTGLDDRVSRISGRVAWRWNAVLFSLAVATAVLFGPTQTQRLGLALSAPSGDQFIATAQAIVLEVDLSDSAIPFAMVQSQARLGVGSRYRKHLTDALASRGPSPAATRQISEFIARWNLGGARIGNVSEPQPTAKGWIWQFELVELAQPLEVAIWPVTWVQESHIREVRIRSARMIERTVPNLHTEGDNPLTVVWTRPNAITDVERFAVRWGEGL